MPVDQDVPSAKVEAQIADMASPRPWDGDEPPLSIYVDAASFSYDVLTAFGADGIPPVDCILLPVMASDAPNR